MTEVKTKVEFGRNGKGVERLWLRVHAVFCRDSQISSQHPEVIEKQNEMNIQQTSQQREALLSVCGLKPFPAILYFPVFLAACEWPPNNSQ